MWSLYAPIITFQMAPSYSGS